MRARKVNTATRRIQIAKAALVVICSEGMTGLSIASIAGKIGVVPSTVYKHYSGKAEVLDAVLDLLQQNICTNVDSICEETENPVERLELLLKRHMDMMVNNRAFPQIVFSQCSQGDDVDITLKVKETMEFFISKVNSIIDDGKEKGVVRKDISSSAAAYMFIGMILPAAMLFRLSPETFDPSYHVQNVWPLYLESIKMPTY
jgi:AcrR family transcriptional regulator